MARNFYAILGVTGAASPEEIKAAYRRRAREFHPDRFGADSGPFLAVQEAYEVLGDPGQRRSYDEGLERGRLSCTRPAPPLTEERERPPVEPLDSPRALVDLGHISLARSFRSVSPSFEELFDRLWRNFSGLRVPKAGRPQALVAEITLSPEEARWGGQARIGVPAHARCPTCGGHGAVGPYECWRCAGEGGITGEIPVVVSVPPGIRDQHEVLMPLDRLGIRNLYLTVRFRVSERVE